MSMLAGQAVGVLLWTIAALMPETQARAQSKDPILVGNYVVVGARAASDVAAPLDVREADRSKALMGTRLSIGDSISWYRPRCAVRQGTREPGAAVIEPNLADLQFAPASNDSRVNQNRVLDCLGGAPNDIWNLLVVDRRVLVARTSPFTTYLILEQPLAPGDVRLLKQRLAKAGFDPGSSGEGVDDTTRAAIAAFANKNGIRGILLPGIITENLLSVLASGP